MPLPDIPRLHLVTDSDTLERPGFLAQAVSAMEAGGAGLAVHVRGPRSTGRNLYETAVALGPTARSTGALLLANDRLDVALAANLDGAHLGERSLPVPEARALLGPDWLIGASTHDRDGLLALEAGGANYAFMGTLYQTASHPGRPGLGTAALARMLDDVPGIPVIAIGGIVPDRVEAVLRTGACGVAVLRGVWSAEDPTAAVLDYLVALE